MCNMDLLTARDVTLLLPVSKEQIYDLAREKVIPSIRIGHKVLFRKSDIEYISQHGTGPKPMELEVTA